jgi:hypothetical protein
MSDDDLFFVSKNGVIWACWLSGKPAVKLGAEAEVHAAMKQFLGTEQASPRDPAPAPSPTTLPEGQTSRSVWQSAEPRYIDPSPPPPPPQARVLKERAAERHDLTIIGRIFTARGSRDVTILDLSETGCQFHDPGGQLEQDARLTVKLGPVGPVESTVRWRRKDSVGIQFSTPLYPAVLEHIRGHFDIRRR